MRLHHAAGALSHQGFQIDTVDDIQRVEHVALGLGHLVALAVAHQTVHIHGLERNLRGAVLMLHQVHGQHDHARYPEEDDVEAGHQHIGGVEGLQRLGLFRPAQGGEGPQARAEPGIQHVIVLAQNGIAQIVLGAHLRLVAADIDVTRLVVPRRNTVAPPQLAGNTPVLDVAHPGEIHVLVLLGHELDAAIFHRSNRLLGQRLGGDVPLVGQPGLDHCTGAVTARGFQTVRLDLFQQTCCFKVSDDALARLEAIQPGIGGGQGGVHLGIHAAINIEHLGGSQNRRVLVQHVDQRQVVALAHFIVIEVMGRGDLHAAGTEFGVAVIVADNRNAPAHQRQLDELADQRLITLIFRVHRHSRITQHGFRTGGGNDQIILAISGGRAVGQRITQVPQRTGLVVVLHFQIGNGGMERRVPVHQPLATVDQPVLVQTDKGLLHRSGHALIHGEALTAPIHRTAQAANLTGNGAAGLLLPLPDLLQKLLPAQVMPAHTLSRQLTLHHHLGGDTRMVGTRLPQGVATLHAAEADQRIHDRVVEAMAHVQAAGHVRRRQGNGIGLTRPLRSKVIVLLPGLVPGRFDGVGLVGFIHGCSECPVSGWRRKQGATTPSRSPARPADRWG